MLHTGRRSALGSEIDKRRIPQRLPRLRYLYRRRKGLRSALGGVRPQRQVTCRVIRFVCAALQVSVSGHVQIGLSSHCDEGNTPIRSEMLKIFLPATTACDISTDLSIASSPFARIVRPHETKTRSAEMVGSARGSCETAHGLVFDFSASVPNAPITASASSVSLLTYHSRSA